jgi:transcriptional regulator with XRE-family HTH domain
MRTLLEIRKAKGLKSVEIARQLNISQGYYSHLESGTRKVTEQLLVDLARILEVNVEELRQVFQNLKPLSTVVNNWIPKIRIKGKSVFEAFREEKMFLMTKPSESEAERITRFVKFIEYNIGSSITEELAEDDLLKEYLLNKIN